jgi:hypothetical protein
MSLRALSLLLSIAATAGTVCDVYDAAGTPCVAAHSTVRALYSAFNGSLYLVNRSTDNATKSIGVLSIGGVANSLAQDVFCASAECTILRIFDQSNEGNHLDTAPGGPFYAHAADSGVNATRSRLTIGGHPVYGAHFEPGMGYRNDDTSGIATGDDPECMYMVTAGQHYNDQCCFDYGNAEVNVRDDGVATMEAVYWGNASSLAHHGPGPGPFVMADLENGVWAGHDRSDFGNNTFLEGAQFVTAMLKGGSGKWALKGGDAQAGALSSLFEGARPFRYNPMKKQVRDCARPPAPALKDTFPERHAKRLL